MKEDEFFKNLKLQNKLRLQDWKWQTEISRMKFKILERKVLKNTRISWNNLEDVYLL